MTVRAWLAQQSERKEQLYRYVPVEEVEAGDILLEPCPDGECDGPWHEARVDLVRRDEHNVYLTADLESGASEIWLRFYGDRVHILPRTRRLTRPNLIQTADIE